MNDREIVRLIEDWTGRPTRTLLTMLRDVCDVVRLIDHLRKHGL